MRVHKKMGEINPQRFRLRVQNVFFSVTPQTRPFGHLSCTDLDQIWNKRRESCPHAYIGEKISQFPRKGFPGPQTAKIGNFEGCLWSRSSSNDTISDDGNRFGGQSTSQGYAFGGPTWVLVGDVRFGSYEPWKTQCRRSVLSLWLPFTFQRHSQGGSTLFSIQYLNVSQIHWNPSSFVFHSKSKWKIKMDFNQES